MIITRTATARYQGMGKAGQGSLTTQSGVLDRQKFGFNTRMGDEPGTNPEELIAAAHAGCFTMALAFGLENAGFTADAIETEAQLTMEQVQGGFAITAVHLTTRARVPNIDAAKFNELASGAKANCPVSKVLNATITMEATLA